MKSPRRAWDWYPTPPAVTRVVRDWLALRLAGERELLCLDPAAGDGTLIAAMRGARPFSEAHWSAIEINPYWESLLEDFAEHVQIDDALVVPWPEAIVVANPPFCALDAFWARIVAHRDLFGVWCAALTPVAWWNAEKRSDCANPDHLISLSWRPRFHREKTGPAHKGSQDFVWAVLEPSPRPTTTWQRAERPN